MAGRLRWESGPLATWKMYVPPVTMLTAMAVEWTDEELDPAPPLSDERIAEVEAAIGVDFPEDYLAVVRIHQGGTPEPSVVTMSDGSRTVLNSLLHFEDEPGGTSLPRLMSVARAEPAIPESVVPFAIDPGGNLFCFDFRNDPSAPPVVFWVHDDPGAPLVPVADGFSDLENRLEDD